MNLWLLLLLHHRCSWSSIVAIVARLTAAADLGKSAQDLLLALNITGPFIGSEYYSVKQACWKLRSYNVSWQIELVDQHWLMIESSLCIPLFWLILIGVGWFWLILIDADWCWLILIDVGWFWLMLIDVGWFWLMLIDVDWRWLMLVDSDWCWLVLINTDWFWLILRYFERCWLMMIDADCIPDICHLYHLYIGGEKNRHVEKFQISKHARNA